MRKFSVSKINLSLAVAWADQDGGSVVVGALSVVVHIINELRHVFSNNVYLTCVDSGKHVQPPFKLRNSKWCSVSR